MEARAVGQGTSSSGRGARSTILGRMWAWYVSGYFEHSFLFVYDSMLDLDSSFMCPV